MKLAAAACFAFAFAAPAFAQKSDHDRQLKDGNIYYDRQEWDKALKCFEAALKADPKSSEAQALIGSTLSQKKEWKKSIEAFEKALKLVGSNDEIKFYTYKEMGLTYGQTKEYEKSVGAFKEALKVQPKSDMAWRNLGVSYALLEDWDEAAAAFQKSLDFNSNQPGMREKIADCKRKAEEARTVPAPPRDDGKPQDHPTLEEERDPDGPVTYRVPNLAGLTFGSDATTLYATIPDAAELFVFDTAAEKEGKRLSLDFKPVALCIQGETLYATAQGSSLVYALDPKTGNVKKEIKVPGDPLTGITAHPSKGMIYVSNAKAEIMVIDPKDGTAKKSEARGTFLSIDAAGAFLYSGWTSSKDWDIEVEKNPDGTTTYYYDDWGYRSQIRKFAVNGKDLKQVASNDNAAVNGRAMHLSPDGKRITVIGGGGWRPKRGGGGSGGYVAAIYSTDDLQTMLGQVEYGAYPLNLAFHPVLNIGVALKTDALVFTFNAKSLAQLKKFTVSGMKNAMAAGVLGFAARGTKILWYEPAETWRNANETGRLVLIPLELTGEDKASIEKYYSGKGAAAVDQAALFKQAEAAEKSGDKAKALKLYRQVSDADPTSELGNKAAKKILQLDDK